MNTINNIGPTDPVQQLANNPISRSIPTDSRTPAPVADRLELSGASQFLQALQANNIRADKVAGVRAQIESGAYEDDAKLDVAADKLLDELNK